MLGPGPEGGGPAGNGIDGGGPEGLGTARSVGRSELEEKRAGFGAVGDLGGRFKGRGAGLLGRDIVLPGRTAAGALSPVGGDPAGGGTAGAVTGAAAPNKIVPPR